MDLRALCLAVVTCSSCAELAEEQQRSDAAYNEAYQRELQKIAQRESDRQDRERQNAQVRRDNRRHARDVAQIEAQVRADAKKRGFFDVDFRHGLIGTIGGIGDGKISVRDAAHLLVWLNDADDEWRALQVVSQDDVLFAHPSTQTIVWLRGYARGGGKTTWLEGSSLRGRDFEYAVIRETKIYSAAFGTRQAIIVEPAF